MKLIEDALVAPRSEELSNARRTRTIDVTGRIYQITWPDYSTTSQRPARKTQYQAFGFSLILPQGAKVAAWCTSSWCATLWSEQSGASSVPGDLLQVRPFLQRRSRPGRLPVAVEYWC